MCAALVVTAASTTAARDPAAKRLDAAVAAREARGLPAGRAYVAGLMRRTNNAASEAYGYPLTNAEYKELLSRSAYALRFQHRTLPHVEKLEGYAGHWIDRKTGKIAVALTNVRKNAKERVRLRLPKQNLGVSFVEVNDSAAALDRALDRSDTVWTTLESSLEPQAYAIRYRENRLVVKVLESQLAQARSHKGRLEAELGVDVGFEVTTPIVDTACAERHKCFDPLRLGARMNYPDVYDSSSPLTQWNCAIGFMLSNETILTAGHCTYQKDSPWHGHQLYKDSFGRIGEKQSTRYTTESRDLALIKIDDGDWNANKSSRVFGAPWPHGLTQEAGPDEGMDVCASLSRQDKYWCGFVNDSSNKWKSDTADPPIWVYGASMKFDEPGRTSEEGDSGGPVVFPTGCGLCQDPLLTPIGIINAGNEADDVNGSKAATNSDLYFAKVQWALNNAAGWPHLSIHTAN